MTTKQHPPLGQLFSQFIHQRVDLQANGLGEMLEAPEEVVPHQAAGAAVVEPRMALQEAVEVASYMLDQKSAVGFTAKAIQHAPEWASLVRAHDSMSAIPFALGNYPQLMRNIAPLYHGDNLADLRPKGDKPVAVESLAEWGTKNAQKGKLAEALFAVGALRLAHQFEQAAKLLNQVKADAPAEWTGLIANEEAALAWQHGDAATAEKLWKQNPQSGSPAVLFNRGMAALFNDRKAEAAELLSKALESIPETNPWHNLGRLYLTLAE